MEKLPVSQDDIALLDIEKDDVKSILQKLREREGDELVDEFERIFKNRIPLDIADLVNARNYLDFQAIRIKAHFLSTTMSTLKFNQGSAIIDEIEKAVDKDLQVSVLTLTDYFIDYLNSALNSIK